MRLADFILENVGPILGEWESFARGIWPDGVKADPLALRDHAEDVLRATVADMKSAQTPAQQSDKSKGEGRAGGESGAVNTASDVHAVGRVRSGFDLIAMVAEYRALRASVVRLWRDSGPAPDRRDLDDLTRFNESIDQSLTKAIRSYTEQVDRSRQMFLAILGHDLRNPLNSVAMSAELLSGAGLDADSSQAAAQITASVGAMAGMISDLLDFTGTGLGAAMPLSLEPTDLGAVCRDVVGEVRAAHPTRTLRYQPHGDLTGEWDAARLRQLVSNLVGNAVQHGAAGPVELTATAEGRGVVLAVRNEGPPIPPDAIGTMFNPLVRGFSPESQKRRRPGSIGLGLYIAREVVTAHGGSIDVRSSVEEATVFTVRLPRHAATQ